MPIDYLTELDDKTEREQSRTLCESHGQLRTAIDDLDAIAYWYKYRSEGLCSDKAMARNNAERAAQKTYSALVKTAKEIQPEYSGWGGLENQDTLNTEAATVPKDDITKTEHEDQIKAFDFCISAIYQAEWSGGTLVLDTIVEGLRDGRDEAERRMKGRGDA